MKRLERMQRAAQRARERAERESLGVGGIRAALKLPEPVLSIEERVRLARALAPVDPLMTAGVLAGALVDCALVGWLALVPCSVGPACSGEGLHACA